MDNRDLRIFKAVYEERHFARAGKRLNTVQSNVSARIKALETELDVSLFHRSRQKVEPSTSGKLLYNYACKLILLEEEARAQVKHPGGVAGPLRLGSMETTAAVRLPDLLAAFHRRFPDVDLSLSTATTEHLVRQVVERDLDLAFIGGSVNEERLTQRPVYQEKLSIFSDQTKTIEDVNRSSVLVFRQGCAYRRHLEVYLFHKNIYPRKVIEMGTLDGILGCVASGMGLTMLPRSVVLQHRLSGDLVEHLLPDNIADMITHVIYPQELSNNPVLIAFLNELPNPTTSLR